MTKKKKRRSQAPVALVYFLTLLLALSLAGGVSYYLLKKYEVFKPGVTDSETSSEETGSAVSDCFSVVSAFLVVSFSGLSGFAFM